MTEPLLYTSPPSHLKGEVAEAKGQRVIFERYYASLLIHRYSVR